MKRSASINFIFVTILIDIIGIGLMFPILPDYIRQLSHLDVADASRHYGWLISLYAAMQFIFAPLLGRLSDRVGRRPVLLFSMLFAGVDYVLMAMAPNLAWLYVGRVISGVTGASFTAANAYIADISAPEERAQNFGIITAAFGIGFIIGPALGGVLGHYGVTTPLWVAAFLCFVNLLYGWFILPESLKEENRRDFTLKEANPVGALFLLGKYPVVWGLTGTLIATNLGMRCLESTWVLFCHAQFGWDKGQIGFSLGAFGAMALTYQLWLARIILPRWGEKRTMLVGLATGAVELVAYAVSPYGWLMYIIMVIGGIGMLGGQATQGLLSQQVGEDEQGALQGALSSLQSVTGIVGPIIATALFARFNGPHTTVQIPGIAFFLASFLNVVGFVIALRAMTKLRVKPNANPCSVDIETVVDGGVEFRVPLSRES